MQDNLRLVMWTITAIIGLWIIASTVHRNMFLYMDSDNGFHGTLSLNKTDIGAKCGKKWVNSDTLVIYKINTAGQLVFLCPRGLWPISKSVIAASITNDFKTSVSDETLQRLNTLYPGATNPVSDSGVPQQLRGTMPSTQIRGPHPAALRPHAHRSSAPPNQPVVVTPGANPFLGAPLPPKPAPVARH